jgi:hypothetical protein
LFGLSSILNAALAAQVPQTPAQLGAFSGVVVDSARRPLPGVEVLLGSSRLIAVTAQDGGFRTLRIPYGSQRLLFRRIGLRPRNFEVVLNAPVQVLDTLVLQSSPVVLPELAVEEKLEPPGFFLDTLGRVDNIGPRIGYWRYREYGASMSQDHSFILIDSAPYKNMHLIAKVYGYRGSRPWSKYSGRLVGSVCYKEIDAPIAIAHDETRHTYRVLNADGKVAGGPMQGYLPRGCIRSLDLQTIGPILTASPLPGGWAVVTRDTVEPSLRFFNLFGRQTVEAKLRDLFGRDVPPSSVTLSRGSTGAIITLNGSPYTWVEVDSAGKPLVMAGPFDSLPGRDRLMRESDILGWKSYGVLPIDRGYLQEFEKPNRTARKLIVYDIIGRPSKRPDPGTIPIFIASVPIQRRLLGILYKDPFGMVTRLYEYEY